jgi:hypothetical protein
MFPGDAYLRLVIFFTDFCQADKSLADLTSLLDSKSKKYL